MKDIVIIEYNPFNKEISLKAQNNQWGSEDGLNGNYFEEYSHKIPELIVTQISNNLSVNINFIGRTIELEELKNVCSLYHSKNKDFSYNITHERKYEYNLKSFIKDFKLLPKDCIEIDTKKIIINEVSSNIVMNVIGLYSTGKSTFINALLKDELLHTKLDIATNKLFRIINTDDNSKIIHTTNSKTKQILKKDYTDKEVDLKKILNDYNSQEDISEIKLNINIPGINCTDIGFEILDTPGVNNAENKIHQKIAYDNIRDNETNPIIAFVIHAGNYASTDQEELFSAIKDTLKNKNVVNTERFFFIINRADEIKVKEFDTLIENIKVYLHDKFQDNVNIFYTNSYYAVLINKKLNNIELDEEEEVDLRQYIEKTKILKFLSEYSSISEYAKQSISKYKNINEEDSEEDKLKKALYYTGIPVLEQAIQKYIDNYAIIHKFQYAFDNINQYIISYNNQKEKNIEKKNKLIEQLNILKDDRSSNEDKLQKIKNEIASIGKQIEKSNDDIKLINNYIEKLEPEINNFYIRINKLELSTKKLDDINSEWLTTVDSQIKNSKEFKNLKYIAEKLSERGTASKSAAQRDVRNKFREDARNIVFDFKKILDENEDSLGHLKDDFEKDIKLKGLDEKKLIFNAEEDAIKEKRRIDKFDIVSFGISRLFRDKNIISLKKIEELDICLREELEEIKNESIEELVQLKSNTHLEIRKFQKHIKDKRKEIENEKNKLKDKEKNLNNYIINEDNISTDNIEIIEEIGKIKKELSSLNENIKNIEYYISKLKELIMLKDDLYE
jgi:hypothetical protein